MPLAWAMVRVLQWVASAGFSCMVKRTISCTRLVGICGLRPGRGASFSNACHSHLDIPTAPTRHRLSLHAQGSADLQVGQSGRGQQDHFRPLGHAHADTARAYFSNCCRCSSESSTAAAICIMSTSAKVSTMHLFRCSLIYDALHEEVQTWDQRS
jgi:hypothetical protein